MAKFGNMVRTESVKMTDEELYTMEMYFINLMKEVFGTTFRFVNSSSVDVKGNELDYVTFVFKCDERKGRNPDGDRVCANGLSFMVHKEKGYLEVKKQNGNETEIVRDYENAPSFQYSSRLNVYGYAIKYRCRKKESIHINHMFKYGTEAEDLDYKRVLQELKYILTIV